MTFFLPCRNQFVPQMVNSLTKLGLPQTSVLENRRLAIDLTKLIVRWEKRRMQQHQHLPAEQVATGASAAAPAEVRRAASAGVEQTVSALLGCRLAAPPFVVRDFRYQHCAR